MKNKIVLFALFTAISSQAFSGTYCLKDQNDNYYKLKVQTLSKGAVSTLVGVGNIASSGDNTAYPVVGTAAVVGGTIHYSFIHYTYNGPTTVVVDADKNLAGTAARGVETLIFTSVSCKSLPAY